MAVNLNSDSIKRLLDNKNIKRVIYVDESFEREVYKEPLQAYFRENISHSDIKWPIDVEAGYDAVRADYEKWVDESSQSELSAFVEEYGIKRTKSNVEQGLEELLPDGMLLCLTPNEFKVHYIDSLEYSISEDNQLLILMDKYLQDDDPDSGLRLLTNFKNVDYVSCGLFSDKFEIQDELIHWRDCDEANNIYPLSKKRVSGDSSLLLYGLRNILWLKQVSEVKNCVIDYYEGAMRDAKNLFLQLDPTSFDKAIIQLSVNEGCWEFDSMKRFIQLLHNDQLEKIMLQKRNFTNIQRYTKLLKQMSAFSDNAVKPNTDLLKSIQKSEVYSNIDYVNTTFSQIANGDIFEIEGKGQYMLVCQPCNLELRSRADRNASEFVYLLPIEDIFKVTDVSDAEQIKKANSQKYISPLQSIGTSPIECVNLARNVRISPKVLDLVCFNKEGKAYINMNTTTDQLEDASVMQDNMLKRYNTLFQEIHRYVDLCNLICEIPKETLQKGDKLQLLKFLKKPFELGKENLIKADYNDQTGIVDFHIIRVRRYKSIYAQIILQDFTSYQSRFALPYDFSSAES